MTFEQSPVIATEDTSFDSLLNSACQQLWSKQTQYTIRRLNELGEELGRIETELDEFLGGAFSAEMPLEK